MRRFLSLRHDFRRWTRGQVLVIVTDMAKADVLDRVAADLARGHTTPAIQRLSSLVAAHPTDLDLRQRLAAAHRLVGNLVQAGRWAYLHSEADPDEVAAFERAYPSTTGRLRALKWPRGGHSATDFARTRLAALGLDCATARQSPPRRWLSALVILAAPFAILGALTVVRWIS
jgi:hypothetical protein